MPNILFKGGPLDGREANVETRGQIEIPLYGNGYEAPHTAVLVYTLANRKATYLRTLFLE